MRPIFLLLLLVLGILFTRKYNLSPTSSFLRLTRLLQNNAVHDSTNQSKTLGEKVANKLCKDYDYKPPTVSDQSKADDISDQIGELRNHNTVYDLINQGYVQDDLVHEYLKHFVPFLLALGIPLAVTTALFALCTLNWACMRCPCCSFLRCGICDRPATKSRINIYIISSIIFSLLVLGASLGAISLFGDINVKVQGTMCQTTYMLQELNDGNADGWFGIKPLEQVLKTLSNDIYDTRNLFRNMKRNFTSLEDQINEISDDLHNLENGFLESNITRANFLEEESYNPRFTQTLGENMSYAYDTVNTFKASLSDAKSNFDTAVNEFNSHRDDVLSALNSGYAQTTDLEDNIHTSLDWLNRNGERIQRYAKNFTVGLKIALAIFIAISSFALLSAIINLWSKYKYFNTCIHLSWALIGVFMVVSWLAATVLFPATVATVELCQVVDETINNETFTNKTLNAFFGKKQSPLKDAVVVCLRTTGDLLDNFELKDKVGLVTVINTALDDSVALIDEGEIPSTIDITPLRSELDLIKYNGALDDERTAIDLILLTQYSSFEIESGNKCANINDVWALNRAECRSANISPILNISDPDNYRVGEELCIPLGRWMDPSTRNISNRYTNQEYISCSDIIDPNTGVSYSRADFLQIFVNRFMTNRRELGVLIDDINENIDEIDNKANNLLVDAKGALKEPFTEVRDFLGNVGTLIFDQKRGLIYNAQCSFVEEDMRRLYDELCVNLVPTIFTTSITLIVGASMASILTLLLYLAVRKLFSKQVEDDGTRKTFPQ